MTDTRQLNVGFTGHRECESSDWLREHLHDAIDRAVERGARWFMSGGAPGWDLTFLKAGFLARWDYAGRPGGFDDMFSVKGLPNGIAVMAALPFSGFWQFYKEKSPELREELETIEPQLDVVVRLRDGPYHVDKIHARNRYIVNESDVIVAVFDGRKSGGTYSTLKYARKKGKPIFWINPVNRTEQWVLD